jgi:hypothetical protein
VTEVIAPLYKVARVALFDPRWHRPCTRCWGSGYEPQVTSMGLAYLCARCDGQCVVLIGASYH